MRSANVRADAIVFNSALSAYARNRLTLWKPRALAAARHARAAPSDTRNVAGAGDKLSQRARRRDRVKLGAECVRAQPAAAADARAPMPRDMQSWGFPPTTVSYCELQTLRRNLALAPSAERPGRHGPDENATI